MKGCSTVESVEQTWELAKEFAATLKPGDVVCLEGDLGAGKTTFTQGLAAALGATGRVASPTFCIVREHPVRRVESGEAQAPDAKSQAAPLDSRPSLLVHMDLYRLSGEDDVEAIGWDDYLARGAILVVEWPERAGSLIPENAHRIVFRHVPGAEEKRLISFA